MESRFNVGDEVTYHPASRYQGLQTGLTVSKVARKYVTVEINGRDLLFDKETGYEKAGTYASSAYIETEQMREERYAHDDARKRVVDAGFTKRHTHRWKDFSTKTLNAIADILEGVRDSDSRHSGPCDLADAPCGACLERANS